MVTKQFIMAAVARESIMAGNSISNISNDDECGIMLASLQRELLAIKQHIKETALILQEDTTRDPPDDGKREVTTLVDSVEQKQNRMIQRCDKVVKKIKKISPEKEKHYIDIVNTKESELLEVRDKCLLLMEVHITQQLQQLQQTGEKLTRKLHRRIEKDKLTRLSRKPARHRSVVTKSNTSIPPLYKSTFYEAVCKEHNIRRRPVQKGHNLKRTLTFVKDKCKDDIETGEASNSWAITASVPLNCDQTLVKKNEIVATNLPQFIPLKDLLGDDGDQEKIQRRSHTARINRITHTQHQIRHMFERAQTYQNMVCTSQIPEEIEIFTPSPPLSPTIPSSSELCIHKPLVSAKKSLHSPSTQVSSIEPSSSLNYNEEDVDIALSMEHMIVKTDNIKEAKGVSSLWINYMK